MSLTLKISSSHLDKEGLQGLTQELYQKITKETDISLQLGTTEATQGTKAVDIVSIGSIILEFIDSGSLIALLGVLSIYFKREPSLALEFKNPEGLDVKVNAKNIDSADIQQLITQLQKPNS